MSRPVDRPPLRIGSTVVTWHQATTMIVAVVVAAGLWVLLNRTRPGTEMRATVDDRALAGLTGAGPVRANRFAWVLGTQLAAVGGILIAPTVALDASQLSLLIVSAYTAAVFGRLRELGSPGILLSGDPGEGPLLGGAKAQPQPPGRGLLVRRGQRPLLIQTAHSPMDVRETVR